MRFEEQLARRQAEIEAQLERYTAYAGGVLQRDVLDAMRYSLLGGGKRIRAILTLEFCRLFGKDPALAMPAACALEMVHAYSLIHDDLPCMDDDDLRRGKPTCHRQFGEALAVLAGDGLLTLAFETLSSAETAALMGERAALRCLRILSQRAGEYGMLGGQTVDVVYEGTVLSAEAHAEMVRMKTGALICAAVECGCAAAEADEEKSAAALSYAKAVGEAFQITDDLLDVAGDAALMGKSTGADEKKHKNTFVSIHGVQQAKARADALFLQAKAQLLQLGGDSGFLLGLTGSLESRQF